MCAGAGWLCAAPSIVNGEMRGAVTTERVDATGIMSETADDATRHSISPFLSGRRGGSESWIFHGRSGGINKDGKLRVREVPRGAFKQQTREQV